jgi:sec-independent protein translocase protein TatC
MSRFRKQAVVVILIIAALITPTSDVFTLLIVSVPIYLLYEISIVIVKVEEKNAKKRHAAEEAEDNELAESE